MPILQENSSPHPKYIPIINTPPIIEDLTFTLKPKTIIGHLMKDIKSVSPLIRSTDLKDVYQRNFTFTITYRHKTKPLTDQEIAPIRKKIVQSLYKKHSAQLVGNLS
jgi:phenylalanyl-tRNA synthetase beta subunit